MSEHHVIRRRRIDPRKNRREGWIRLIAPRHLTRAARTQRIALIVLVLLLGLYVLIAPSLDFGPRSSGSATTGASASKSNLGKPGR